jgi:hypothetical protein
VLDDRAELVYGVALIRLLVASLFFLAFLHLVENVVVDTVHGLFVNISGARIFSHDT